MLATESCHQSPSVRNGEFVALAPITNIHAKLTSQSTRPTLRLKIFISLTAQISELFIQPFHGKFIQGPPQHGARIVFYDITDENAEGREPARTRRNNHPWNPQSRSQFAGMQSSSSAEGH